MSARRIVLALLGIVLAGAAVMLPAGRREEGPRPFQGYIEGRLVLVAPEDGGRIERLAVAEGEAVREGQAIFALDDALQGAQRAEAAARLMQARAQLANLQAAQQRPEQVAVLRAAEERARAALELSEREYERQRTLLERGITAAARVDAARAAFERDQAALLEAQRQIRAAQLTGRTGEIEAADAAVAAAEAVLRQAETRLARRRVEAPAAAVVQEIYFRPGEVVSAGQPVLALLPHANRKARFYVPEPFLARFALGQQVAVLCDRCPAGLTGRVSFVSREAEFTPPVIFSEQERAKLVVRVEADLDGRGSALPLGLPVSVRPLDGIPVATR